MPTNKANSKHPDSSNTRLEDALKRYGEKAAFSPMFADRVQRRINAALPMQKISPLDALGQELILLFRRTAFFGAALVVLLAAYNIAVTGDISLSGAFGISDATHEVLSQSSPLQE